MASWGTAEWYASSQPVAPPPQPPRFSAPPSLAAFAQSLSPGPPAQPPRLTGLPGFAPTYRSAYAPELGYGQLPTSPALDLDNQASWPLQAPRDYVR